jgi:hypothetical protein
VDLRKAEGSVTADGYVRPLVNVDARSGNWEEAPWPSAFELARLLPDSSWTLVGGLMVKMHAEIAGLPAPRTTVDVDSALHLETQATSFGEAASLLRRAGYVLNEDTKHAYRFDRGTDQIDLMCADRQAIWKKHKFGGRPLFGIPGGTRALRHTINVDVQTRVDTVRLVVPTLQGALVLKGAAYQEDSRDKGRHAEDAVLLLACVTDSKEIWIGLSPRSRRRVRAVVNALVDRPRYWANHDDAVQSLARESLAELSAIIARGN